jgi:hypothetical protein
MCSMMMMVMMMTTTTVMVLMTMQVLAALVNVAAHPGSQPVIAQELRGIPLFVTLAGGVNAKASEFAMMALCNLAAHAPNRRLIVAHGGLTTILAGVLSETVGRRRAGIAALANMALDPDTSLLTTAKDARVIRRLIRITTTGQIPGNRETAALLHNLCCHADFAPLLRSNGAMRALQECLRSPVPTAVDWASRAVRVLAGMPGGGDDSTSTSASTSNPGAKGDGLPPGGVTVVDVEPMPAPAARAAMSPVRVMMMMMMIGISSFGSFRQSYYATASSVPPSAPCPLLVCHIPQVTELVEWNTWGSRLDTYFSPVFTKPQPAEVHVETTAGQLTRVHLGAKVYRGWKAWGRVIQGYEIIQPPANGVVLAFDPKEVRIILMSSYTSCARFRILSRLGV